MTLERDLQTAFATHKTATDANTPIQLNIEGEGRIAKDFADLLVKEIEHSNITSVALVRNDLLIQFLVSSINLRCAKSEVKAFKIAQEAETWLASLT